MAEVTKFPEPFLHHQIVEPKEIYEQPEPSEEMVWAICPHLRWTLSENRCYHCPRWEHDERHGQVQRGCYGLAQETVKITMAMLCREGKLK